MKDIFQASKKGRFSMLALVLTWLIAGCAEGAYVGATASMDAEQYDNDFMANWDHLAGADEAFWDGFDSLATFEAESTGDSRSSDEGSADDCVCEQKRETFMDAAKNMTCEVSKLKEQDNLRG